MGIKRGLRQEASYYHSLAPWINDCFLQVSQPTVLALIQWWYVGGKCIKPSMCIPRKINPLDLWDRLNDLKTETNLSSTREAQGKQSLQTLAETWGWAMSLLCTDTALPAGYPHPTGRFYLTGRPCNSQLEWAPQRENHQSHWLLPNKMCWHVMYHKLMILDSLQTWAKTAKVFCSLIKEPRNFAGV